MKLKSGAITLTAAGTLLAATAFAQNQSGTQSAQDQGAQGQQMSGQTQPGQAQGAMEASTSSPSDVRQIQQALKDKGFDAGPIDGQLGPQTEQALRSFQQAQGLQASGQIDQKTMAALGVQAGQSTQGATPPQGTQAQGGGAEQGAGGAATSAPSTTESMPGGQSSPSPSGATTR
jgi:peptidoglycan hydrolase-like protein with peptidoglycan-binding domain